ncbi:MAG: IMPACT family protein [Methylohalobius sp. ZOD2]|nr:YigZ family protein [Methylothermaceae bacterium]
MSEFTVDRSYSSEYVIKRSRFIAIVAPCDDTEILADFLQQLYSDYPQASHITYAWRIQTSEGLRERCFDAGEPSGTAGRPILQHLQGKQLVNISLAVIRYFGGIKLGAGGLARAYGQAARQVLESAVIQPHILYQTLEVTIDYADYHSLEQRLAPLGASVVDAEFGARVNAVLRIPETQVEAVEQLLQSRY